jgi:Domain of unknown function (DUF6798)
LATVRETRAMAEPAAQAPDSSDSDVVRDRAAVVSTALVAVAVFGSFLAYSLIQAPIPAPNEPHYLCKAKHYWDPDFCPGDFFLESSNPHLVFYQTVGLLTLWMSLPQTAFVGRLVAYALLAVGWTSCVSRMSGSRAAPLWAAWVFLAIATVGNLSGEWMVGGVEAKVFAYAFVFLAIARLFDRRWRAAGIFAGLAVSFHPVVGGWAVVAGGVATAVSWCLQRRSDPDAAGVRVAPGERTQMWMALLLGVLFALPGLVPAVRLVLRENHKSAASANMVQVFDRLGHHLDPRRFRSVEVRDYEIEAAWLGYALLGLFALGLYSQMECNREQTWFGWFVLAAAAIAVGGLFVGLVPRLPNGEPDTSSALFDLRVSLMKFYPFRLADVFIPVAAAVSLVVVLERGNVAWISIHARAPLRGAGSWSLAGIRIHATSWLRRLSSPAIFVGFFAFACLRPIRDRNPSHMTRDEFADWQAVCRWCDEELPSDAVVLTPQASNWGFKWYARRTEYVSYKDCPQDAAGILEWRRRLRFITTWGNENYRDGYSRGALRKLAKEGITHVVTYPEIGPLAIRPAYPRGSRKNEHFRVYRLKDAKSK